MVVMLIELVSLVAILHAAVSDAKKKDVRAATLSGAVALFAFYLLPTMMIRPTITTVCENCPPVAKFCIGTTALIALVLFEQVAVNVMTYRDEGDSSSGKTT